MQITRTTRPYDLGWRERTRPISLATFLKAARSQNAEPDLRRLRLCLPPNGHERFRGASFFVNVRRNRETVTSYQLYVNHWRDAFSFLRLHRLHLTRNGPFYLYLHNGNGGKERRITL